ncbi:MAG: hypothetical protein IJD58_07760 [Lachnospiraceae bacterium]|nr:hypothetical protein [Lachnospiraceae bacterium]
MDIKINGNLQLQNEYKINPKDMDNSKEIEQRSAVFSRNVDAFKKTFDSSKGNIYSSKGENFEDKTNSLQDNMDNEMVSANMIECIDTLKSMVTPEDYSQLEEWGLVPDEDNPEAFVTVYERIQIELMAYSDEYNAPGVNVNSKKFKSVLGNEAAVNALKHAKDMKDSGKISSEAKKYILENNLKPTLNNVYKALHTSKSISGAGVNQLSNEQWQQLKPQVESFFEKNGFENNSGNVENAKWIISNNLPLNVDNFTKLDELNQVDFSDEQFMSTLEENIGKAVSIGNEPMDVLVTGKDFDETTIKEAVETVQSAMDSDVDYILKNNRKLNIKNLKERIEERKKEDVNKSLYEKKEASVATNKILIEARAMLTQGSLFTMQRMGVNITYTEITVMMDIAVESKNVLADNIFMLDGNKPSETDRNLLMETMDMMTGFNRLPIAVAGSVYSSSIEFTVSAVHREGSSLLERYKLAGESYEALGTSIRKDLGDNIKKAFRNVDELLSGEGIEVNDENRRVARVLGYNSIEITAETVHSMGNIVSQLDMVTKNLTPKAAVHLIRNGINPLNTNIEELNAKLIEINAELTEDNGSEKYSEYLWKLEKNKSISKDERAAYIQLYRIMEHINREDGRAVGSVAKSGANLTLANLYSAVKTLRAGNIDKTIDDDFGLLESGYSEDDLTRFMENAASLMEDKQLHNEYKYERFMKKLDKVLDNETISEQELLRITSTMEKSSLNNIYNAMIALDNNFYKAMKNDLDEKTTSELQKIEDMWGSEEGEFEEEQAVAAYENLKRDAHLSGDIDSFERSLLKNNMINTFSYMAKQATNRSYYVPMEIAGEETVVHMTFKEGSAKEKGRITIFAETVSGKLSVLIKRKNEAYEVCAAVSNLTLKETLENYMDGKVVLSDKVSDGMWTESLSQMSYEETTENDETTYGELVREAKSFIHKVLKNI